MIEHVRIENFKSIEGLSLALGRVNMFIGENGAGKSNILEALALAAAAEGGKLDNEFLASRGVRVSSARLMRSAFDADRCKDPISVIVRRRGGRDVHYELTNDNKPYSSWEMSASYTAPSKKLEEVGPFLQGFLERVDEDERQEVAESILNQMQEQILASQKSGLKSTDGKVKVNIQLSIDSSKPFYLNEGMSDFDDFVIYSTENSALRTFDKEGQIQPLGVSGEGLLRFLEVISADRDKRTINTIKDALCLFDWFGTFDMKKRRSGSRMSISDSFLDEKSDKIDQRSANEGFLFVAFYFSLLASELTPKFFAVDNVDTALNPKLCQEVVSKIAQLTAARNKQIIMTTHNPAALDGLDLNDDEQRLFVVSRTPEGKTRARRFRRKPSGDQPSRLSELFIRGALGGLPKNF